MRHTVWMELWYKFMPFLRLPMLAMIAVLSGCAIGSTPIDVRLPSLAPLIARHASAVVGIARRELGAKPGEAEVMGSGFRLEGTNLIATASHVVIALGEEAPVVVWEGRSWSARVFKLDREADVALLQVDEELPILGFKLAKSEAVRPGDWVMVLGRPFGRLPVATIGIVSSLPGAVPPPYRVSAMLQINAAINAGNSGGPVIDLFGRVVGVASANIPSGQGLGFAVPVSALCRLLAPALGCT